MRLPKDTKIGFIVGHFHISAAYNSTCYTSAHYHMPRYNRPVCRKTQQPGRIRGSPGKHSHSPSLRSAQRALGRRIRQLREENGWSQNALASLCGTDRSRISRIEHGETNLRFSVLGTIAEAFKV